MSRQFLAYGDHTPSRAWVLTLRPLPILQANLYVDFSLYVRLGSPACRRRVGVNLEDRRFVPPAGFEPATDGVEIHCSVR